MFDASLGNSFVGSPADYRRWALEVAGVGTAKVISAQDDTGLVTIVLTDSDGMPAQQGICTAVENHIMRYDSWYERLASLETIFDGYECFDQAVFVENAVKI